MNPTQENPVPQSQPVAQNELTPQQLDTLKLLSKSAIILWVIALPFSAYVSPDPGGNLPAFSCFIMGWLGLLGANFVAGLAWLSNFFAYAVFKMSRAKQPPAKKLLAYSVVGFVLSFGAFAVTSYPRDEGGSVYYTVKPGISLYLWLLAIACASAMGFYRYRLLRLSNNR